MQFPHQRFPGWYRATGETPHYRALSVRLQKLAVESCLLLTRRRPKSLSERPVVQVGLLEALQGKAAGKKVMCQLAGDGMTQTPI